MNTYNKFQVSLTGMVLVASALITTVLYVHGVVYLKEQPVIHAFTVEYTMPHKLASEHLISDEVTIVLPEKPESFVEYIPPIQMKAMDGSMVETDQVEIDVQSILELYNANYDYPNWDKKQRINLVEALWEFLVGQQGVSPTNAAAIIGCIYAEGDFTEQQSTNHRFTDIDDVRSKLGYGKYGYGIVQWTTKGRQKYLLEYYELTNNYSDDWQSVCIMAECSMLYEELKAWEIFNNIYEDTTLEDAVGRMSKIYEAYDGSQEDWACKNGSYKLQRNNSGGSYRLQMAESILDYFSVG